MRICSFETTPRQESHLKHIVPVLYMSMSYCSHGVINVRCGQCLCGDWRPIKKINNNFLSTNIFLHLS